MITLNVVTYMTETVPPPGDWLTQTPSRVDEDQLLGMAVCENFTANSDALVNKGNNYYYYDWANHPTDPNIMDPAYKEPRLYIPWDLDTSAGSGTDTMSVLDEQGLGGHLFQGMIKQQELFCQYLDERQAKPFVRAKYCLRYLLAHKYIEAGERKKALETIRAVYGEYGYEPRLNRTEHHRTQRLPSHAAIPTYFERVSETEAS